MRDAAGILDLPGFSRFLLRGRDVAGWLERLITGRVPAVGRVGLGYFADAKGRLVTEMSIARLAEDELLLITAAAAEWHDRALLEAALPPDGSIRLEDQTEAWSCQILTGPASRAILTEVTDGDLSLPWLSVQAAQVAGRPVRLMRVSFAGELGWEVHSGVGDTPAVFDALWRAGQAHGLRPFGMFALDSLRLEKGYRAWKQDLSTDYSVLQSGLERFVAWDKGEFVGRDALLREKQQGLAKRFVTLLVEGGDYDPPYMSTLWHGGQVVGETTSAGWGHRLDRLVALGMLRSDLAEPGTAVEVEVYGERYPAVVQPEGPLWDPKNERLRT